MYMILNIIMKKKMAVVFLLCISNKKNNEILRWHVNDFVTCFKYTQHVLVTTKQHCLCTRTQTHNTHRHAHTDTDTHCFSCPATPNRPDVRFLSQHRSKPQDRRPMMWRGNFAASIHSGVSGGGSVGSGGASKAKDRGTPQGTSVSGIIFNGDASVGKDGGSPQGGGKGAKRTFFGGTVATAAEWSNMSEALTMMQLRNRKRRDSVWQEAAGTKTFRNFTIS